MPPSDEGGGTAQAVTEGETTPQSKPSVLPAPLTRGAFRVGIEKSPMPCTLFGGAGMGSTYLNM